MKKIVVVLGAFIMLFSLAACNRRPELNAPENVRREGEMIYWDSVRGASHYIVRIDESDTYEVNVTQFDLERLPNGTFLLEVRAVSQEALSPYSDSLVVSVSRTFPYPIDLKIDDDLLTWEDLEADEYRIWIDGSIHTTVTDNQYTFADLEENMSYTVSVQAVYENGVSDPSSSVKYHYYTEIVQRFNFTHSIQSINDPLLTLKSIGELVSVQYDGDTIDSSDFSINGHLLEITRQYLNALEIGSHAFIIGTSFGLVEVIVDVVDSVQPRIIGGPNFYYHSGQDLVIRYDLFAGEIDVKTTTESVTDRQIIISHEYLDSLLEDNPDRSNYIFTIIFDFGEDEIIISVINVIYAE